VGIAVSPGGNALYIVNSDFDLQFNGGTVVAIDLKPLREFLRPLWGPDPSNPPSDPCLGLGYNPNTILVPGPCAPLDLGHPPGGGPSLVRNWTKIGAFATDLIYVCRPTDEAALITGMGYTGSAGFGRSRCRGTDPDPARHARLFVPVRGDPSLTFFDVDDDRDGQVPPFTLDCGQATHNGRCSDLFRSGIDANDNTRDLTLPAEPFGIAVSDRTDALVVTHQALGSISASLFTGPGGAGTVLDGKPTLQFIYSGSNVPPATGVVALPIPAAIVRELQGINRDRLAAGEPLLGLTEWLAQTNYQQGFGVAYRGQAHVDVYRFFDDSFAAPARPFLTRSSLRNFDVLPAGTDSRDVVVDDSERVACESDCQARAGEANFDLDACNLSCEQVPLGAYLTNRTPPSLVIGQVLPANSTISDESLAFFGAIPLPVGPSRVVVGQIHDRRDPPDVRRPRIFAICFDSRVIVMYDPLEHRVDGQIRTGRGPHSLVMDPKEPIAYVSHFTDSYVGLIDLDQAHPNTFGSIVASIGNLSVPRESK